MKRSLLRVAVLAAVLPFILCSNGLPQSTLPEPDHDSSKPVLINILGRGLIDSNAYKCLTDLSDDIGGRVTGSPAAQRAAEWGVARMQTSGLASVHTEEWTLWKGWARGSATAELITPVARELYVDSIGWTGSTAKGGVDADIAGVNLFAMEDAMKDTERFRGKIILMRADGSPQKSVGILMTQYGAFLRKLQDVGVVAIIVGGEAGFKAQGMHLTHTGSLVVQRESPLPILSMAAEDQGQMERFLDAGKPVPVFISMCRIPLPMDPFPLRTSLVRLPEESIRNRS